MRYWNEGHYDLVSYVFLSCYSAVQWLRVLSLLNKIGSELMFPGQDRLAESLSSLQEEMLLNILYLNHDLL